MKKIIQQTGIFLTLLFFTFSLTACSTTTRSGDLNSECTPGESACGDRLVCSLNVSGETRCASPIIIRGQVLNITTDEPIADALVQAVDINGAATGTSATTDEAGHYTLTIPAIRDDEGNPAEGIYTLRVQAAGYQEFPTTIRPALPLDATSVVDEEGQWVIENTLTTVKLIVLPGDISLLGSISGTIEAEYNAGILVIAYDGTTALTGFSDSDGVYTIFNVTAGSYTIQGYAVGVQLDIASATLAEGESLIDLNLVTSETPLSTVSGTVQIVNASGGSLTSIVLAVESTFVEAAARGTVPPGLRVGDISGGFTLENVPDGNYVVLAAFENDGLVRDPDQTIGGTQIVRIEVPDPTTGNTISISEGFKVTGALDIVAPGAEGPEEIATTTPVLEWADDSSEDGYEIRVFDSFGNEVWSDSIGSVSGSPTVTHTYAGPALEIGQYYQFRATSFRLKNGVQTSISKTEDLKGVFYYLGGM